MNRRRFLSTMGAAIAALFVPEPAAELVRELSEAARKATSVPFDSKDPSRAMVRA